MGRRNKKGNKVDGWVNLDKPVGITSTQAIGKIRRILNAQKAGHAGTLDPLASGILPIALGEATKTIPFMQDADKTYEFSVTWGEQRSTDDAEGDVIASSDVRPTPDAIIAALPAFLGEIEQVPPKFSAIKINGQRAYDLAREGQDIEMKSRVVYIDHLEMLSADEACAHFTMTCEKGTYVRSLARDLAIALGTYGYVSALRRCAVGCFSTEDAISLEKLEQMGDSAALIEALQPVQAVLDDIPALAIKQTEVALLRNGQALSFISKPDFERLSGIDTQDTALAVHHDTAIALVEIDGPSVKPVRVFNI